MQVLSICKLLCFLVCNIYLKHLNMYRETTHIQYHLEEYGQKTHCTFQVF